jgi:RNA polymerase sigma factor (TIGR02999 family)
MVERNGLSFPDRGRFMAYAARVMRGVIVDHARHGRAPKRGGQFHMTSLSPEVADSVPEPAFLARISEALDRLAQAAPELAEVVDLKFFCGFSFAEIAAMRRVSERTVQRQWERARIYLHRALGADAPVG